MVELRPKFHVCGKRNRFLWGFYKKTWFVQKSVQVSNQCHHASAHSFLLCNLSKAPVDWFFHYLHLYLHFFFIYNISAEILFQRISFVKLYSFPLFFRLVLSFKSRCTIVACFCEFVFLCLFERCFDIDMGRQLQATTDANALHRSLWFMIMKIVFAPTCNADGLRVRIHTGSGCEQKTFHFISEEKKSKWKHNSHITHNARNFNILAFSVWIANRTVATEFIALHAIVSRPQCNAMRCYYLLQRSK